MNFKVLIVSLMLLVSFAGLASATTHIPAGTVDRYNLSSTNEVYVLDGNISSSGTAIWVKNANVTLDGQGYTITYDTGGNGYGIMNANIVNNTTIKNTNFVCTNTSAMGTSSDGAHAIYFSSSVNNITVLNCTTNTCNGTGVYLYSGFGHYVNNVTSIVTTTGLGFRSRNINYAAYSNINTVTNSGTGADFTSNNFVTVINLTTQSTSGSGVALSTVKDSNFKNVSTSSVAGANGLSIYSTAINNTFTDVYASALAGYGISYTVGSSNNSAINMTGVSGSSTGMLVKDSANNTFNNSSGISSTSYGISCTNLGYNTFNSCTGKSTTSHGIQLLNTTNNIFTNMTIISPLASSPHSQNHCMLMGDSITAGGAGSVIPLGAWGITLNSTLTNSYISNRGVSGERADQGLQRLGQELQIFKPQIVTIMYGTNDLSQSRTQQSTINDIISMAQLVKSNGAMPVILLTTPVASNNNKWIWLDQNLSSQANVLGIKTIMVYDAIDAIPGNGVYDDCVADTLLDGTHPVNNSNALIGTYIARNFLAASQVYTGTNLSNTIDSIGYIKNSRDIRPADITPNAKFIPNTGNVTVRIDTWLVTGDCKRVWNESSTTAASTRHVFGNFPANVPVQIKRDGANYEVMTSNSTGYIDWTYSGGYSEHTFEVTAGSPVTLTVTSLNALNSSSEAATNITLSAETQYTGMGALYNSVRDTISSGYTLASLIVLVIGAYALFRYMGYL